MVGSGLGEALSGAAHDIYYLGGGQDRDQLLCAEDLVAGKREALHEAALRGAVVLGVCGGISCSVTPTRLARRRFRVWGCSMSAPSASPGRG